jgi:hypothetical protein
MDDFVGSGKLVKGKQGLPDTTVTTSNTGCFLTT